MYLQKTILLPSFSRGFHLITSYIENEIDKLPNRGMLNLFIHHTSAGLTINENADASVGLDLNMCFNKIAPENDPEYMHTTEGSDDMPAHVKSSLVGCSINIPISNGKINLGQWQGIFLCEFRNHGGPRRITISIFE